MHPYPPSTVLQLAEEHRHDLLQDALRPRPGRRSRLRGRWSRRHAR